MGALKVPGDGMPEGKRMKRMPIADIIRGGMSRMLTFDNLVMSKGITERGVLRKVVRKNAIRNAGCMMLPLTIAYFLFYCFAARLHEDITNVFLLESTMRLHLDEMFVNVDSAADVWEALLGDEGRFMDFFFRQTDIYGLPLEKQQLDDRWGLWGRVETFNQIQGAVRFEQSRRTNDVFGKPHNCADNLTCTLCRQGTGFVPNSARLEDEFDCGDWGAEDAAARRLRLSRVELRGSLAKPAPEEDRFTFWLFPSEQAATIRASLEYFRQRRWIDVDTHEVQIRMYLLNAELGRPRLEQLTVTLTLDAAGGVAYERDLQAIFLEFWHGAMSAVADVCFILVLLASTCYRSRLMWIEFLNQTLFDHLSQPQTICEWLIILFGWYNVYGFYGMMGIADSVAEKLQAVRGRGWDLGSADLPVVEELFAECQLASDWLAQLRVIFSQYSIVLMFRFFVSFGSQSRLAVVLRTMKAVITDILHFVIVFVPTFMAYAISGSLVFGRRIEAFSTIQGSVGACFRIIMESEYDWREMSEEFYWSSTMWAWSFLILVVLLMLNMVLAIILDVYSEVREATFSGEPIWETISNFFLAAMRPRTWVGSQVLETKLKDEVKESMVTRKTLEASFPDMPDKQLSLIFKQCEEEMTWSAASELNKKQLMKLVGTLMGDVQKLDVAINEMNVVEARDPVTPWTTPDLVAKEGQYGMVQQDTSNFLNEKVETRGHKAPLFDDLDNVSDVVDADLPDWLQDVYVMISSQKQWMRYTTWQLEQMQWRIQAVHTSREALPPAPEEGRPAPL